MNGLNGEYYGNYLFCLQTRTREVDTLYCDWLYALCYHHFNYWFVPKKAWISWSDHGYILTGTLLANRLLKHLILLKSSTKCTVLPNTYLFAIGGCLGLLAALLGLEALVTLPVLAPFLAPTSNKVACLKGFWKLLKETRVSSNGTVTDKMVKLLMAGKFWHLVDGFAKRLKTIEVDGNNHLKHGQWWKLWQSKITFLWNFHNFFWNSLRQLIFLVSIHILHALMLSHENYTVIILSAPKYSRGMITHPQLWSTEIGVGLYP